MRTAFQIYTVPGQVYYNSTRKLVLQGVDGVVFVADSGASMTEENLESLRNLEENLNEYGKSLATLPHVIQFNKRDLPDALPLEQLNAQLNVHGAPCFEAVANTGQGVFPTLKALAAAVLEAIHKGGRQNAPQLPPQAPAMPAAAVPQRMGQPAAAHAGHHAQPAYGQPQPGYGQQPVYQQAPAPAASLQLAPSTRQSAHPQAGRGQAPAGAPGLQLASTPGHAAPRASGGPAVKPPAAKGPGASKGPAPAKAPAGAKKKLEQTRFRPRAARPEPRPTPVAKPAGSKTYTWIFIGLAIAVGAVLTKVVTSFF
jgi:hypothetical protein